MRSSPRRAILRLLPMVLSVVVGLALWDQSVRHLHIPSYVLPAPLAVWQALVSGLLENPTSRASFVFQLGNTLQATLAGFVIGSVLAIALAACMAEFRILDRVLLPYFVGFQSLPKVAIAPLYVIWFGYQMESKIAMAATMAFFPVMLNSLQGFLSVETDRMELMASVAASRWQMFRYIRLPGAASLVFGGLNLGIVYALLGCIVSEFLGAQAGMGVIVTQLQSVSDTAGVFAALVILGVVGYVLVAVIRAIQRRVVFWDSGEQQRFTGS
jgi:NitT/TauT family transport system permease protein